MKHKFEELNPSKGDAQAAESGQHILDNIAMALGIPPGLVKVNYPNINKGGFMQRWEYLIAGVGEDGMVQDHTDDVWKPLEELGKAGWELVAVVKDHKMSFPEAYFKRQLSEV